VREVAELAEHERRALLLWQALEVDEQLAQVRAPLDLLVEADRRELRELGGLLAASAQDRQAAVARDRVEPGLEGDLAAAAPNRVVG
jgi:hypothetical protein